MSFFCKFILFSAVIIIGIIAIVVYFYMRNQNRTRIREIFENSGVDGLLNELFSEVTNSSGMLELRYKYENSFFDSFDSYVKQFLIDNLTQSTLITRNKFNYFITKTTPIAEFDTQENGKNIYFILYAEPYKSFIQQSNVAIYNIGRVKKLVLANGQQLPSKEQEELLKIMTEIKELLEKNNPATQKKTNIALERAAQFAFDIGANVVADILVKIMLGG